jgi:ABC-2 type transport system permease protein
MGATFAKYFKWIWSPSKEGKVGNAGLLALIRKELTDQVRSARIYIIGALILLISVGGLISALNGIQGVIANEGSDFVFIKLFTATYTFTSMVGQTTIPSFIGYIAFLAPFIGLVLGFDSISGERSRGTLNRLVSQPIYRDSVIIGKFIAGVTLITVMVLSMGFLVSGIGLYVIGVPPSLEEIIRILVFLIFTIVYISLWLGLSMLFSILFRHPATSALLFIAIWLFLILFFGLIVGAVFPVSDQMPADIALQNSGWNQMINRISPINLYSDSISPIITPGQRTTAGILTASQVEGAVAGSLPLGQSLLLVWPHLTGLLALTMIIFAISYICFMRQEIRAG